MKKLIKIVIIFNLVFLFQIISVKAGVDISTDVNSGYGKTGTNCDSSACWANFGGDNAVRGVRITLVNSKGQNIGLYRKNYIYDYNQIKYFQDGYNYYYWSGECSKAEYIKGTCSSTITLKENGSDLTFQLSSPNNRLIDNFSSLLKDWQLDDIASNFKEEYNNQEDELTTFITNVFFNGKEEIAQEKIKEQKNDLWIVIEPLTAIRYNSNVYLGTNEELASLGYQRMINTSSNIVTVVGRTMACAAYVTSGLALQNPSAPGIVGVNYFGGNLYSIDTSAIVGTGGQTITELCSGNKNVLEPQYVGGSSGSGIGLIYVSGMLKDVQCSDVDNSDKLKSDIEADYDSGTSLTDIYNKYKITYTKDNKTTTGDTKWFVNECTCAGMDSIFDTTYYNVWYSANNSSITSLNPSLGTDWYSRLDTIDLDQLKIERISWILNTYSTDYNKNMSAYVDDLNEKSSDSYSWTDASYSKYKSLSCGVNNNDGISNSCDYIVEWYNANKPTNYKQIVTSISQYNKMSSTDKLNANTMFQAYNLVNSKIDNKWWSLDSTTGSLHSYVLECLGTGSCSYLNNYLGSYYTSKDANTLKNDTTFANRINSFNNLNGTSWTVSSYLEQCKGVTSSIDCTPEYNVGTCLSADQIKYSDSDYWENCIFNDNGSYSINTHKTSVNSGLSYRDTSLGGDYCEVYCTEDLVTNFNADTILVNAGYHFTWSGQSVSGSRTCKTKSINWTQYNSDVDNANTIVEQTYVDWQLEILKADHIENHSISASDDSCDCINSSHGVSCCISASEKSGCACGDSEPDSMSCCDENGENCACGDAKPDSMDCSCGYSCDTADYTRYDLYTAAKASFTLVDGTTNSWIGDSWCSGGSKNTTVPTSDISGKETTYDEAIDKAQGLTNEMAKCYTWNESNVYNLNPTATVEYINSSNGETYYSISPTLTTITDYNLKIDDDCKEVIVPNITSCTGTKCTTENFVNQCTYNYETRDGIANFQYPDDMFRYVLKSNNLSVNYEPVTTNGSFSNNYIDIGYSNFPVAYKTPDGVYGYNSGNSGELTLSYSHLGHMKDGSTALDSILSSSDVDFNHDYEKWQCQYTISSKLICDKSGECIESCGIDLIYRTIDLDNPFPDITGKGRDTGENWCDDGECSNSSELNELVKDYITNNRGVTTEDVYDQEPMYSFTLTPAIINEIRKYNKENSYTDYTGEFDGETYDYKCNTGTGTTCISDYLTHLIEIAGTEDDIGTCASDNTRTYNDPTAFNNCRY